MSASSLLLAFQLSRAVAPCEDYSEIADLGSQVDSYQDMTAEPLTGYCYSVSGACNVNWNRLADDHIAVWWTREMTEITGVRFTSKTTLAWDLYDRGERGEDPATITYEVEQGAIGDWSPGVCTTGVQWATKTRSIGTVPDPGAWFLVHGRNACSGTAPACETP